MYLLPRINKNNLIKSSLSALVPPFVCSPGSSRALSVFAPVPASWRMSVSVLFKNYAPRLLCFGWTCAASLIHSSRCASCFKFIPAPQWVLASPPSTLSALFSSFTSRTLFLKTLPEISLSSLLYPQITPIKAVLSKSTRCVHTVYWRDLQIKFFNFECLMCSNEMNKIITFIFIRNELLKAIFDKIEQSERGCSSHTSPGFWGTHHMLQWRKDLDTERLEACKMIREEDITCLFEFER